MMFWLRDVITRWLESRPDCRDRPRGPALLLLPREALMR
jgi:hypothetical protein